MKQAMVVAGWSVYLGGWIAILYILAMWMIFGLAEYSSNTMELIIELVPSLVIVSAGAALVFLGRFLRRRFGQ